PPTRRQGHRLKAPSCGSHVASIARRRRRKCLQHCEHPPPLAAAEIIAPAGESADRIAAMQMSLIATKRTFRPPRLMTALGAAKRTTTPELGQSVVAPAASS